jgi:hypothetical protein
MTSGNWFNNDGLYLQYGTSKATPETGGDYLSYGANRVIEVLIDLTTLTSTAAIQSNTTFFPAPPSGQLYIEKVELTVETASASGTSFSVGLIQADRATIPSGYSTAFVNALINASTNATGDLIVMSTGSTSAGGLIGTYPAAATGPYYITALSSGTYTTGKVRVRIFYHGVGVITQ